MGGESLWMVGRILGHTQAQTKAAMPTWPTIPFGNLQSALPPRSSRSGRDKSQTEVVPEGIPPSPVT